MYIIKAVNKLFPVCNIIDKLNSLGFPPLNMKLNLILYNIVSFIWDFPIYSRELFRQFVMLVKLYYLFAI